MTVAVDDLPDSITVRRTDPLYNCHSYLTKVPIDAIAPFIGTFTRPGEAVADFFAGSGMTGLAALALGRHARLSDISVRQRTGILRKRLNGHLGLVSGQAGGCRKVTR